MNWSVIIPRFGFYSSRYNRHIYRNGKFGPKFGVRRQGCSVVQLGKDYATRNLWGLRLLRYKKGASWWSIELYFWNGKQR